MFGMFRTPRKPAEVTIRLRCSIARELPGKPSEGFGPGDITNWEAKDAQRLIDRGLAELVDLPDYAGKK